MWRAGGEAASAAAASPAVKMAESVLEVVGKLQSRLAGSSEPKKVTVGGGAAEALPSPAGVVRRSRGSGGPGLPREGGGGARGAGPGRACPPLPPPLPRSFLPVRGHGPWGEADHPPPPSRGSGLGPGGGSCPRWELPPPCVAASLGWVRRPPAVPRETRCGVSGSLRGVPPGDTRMGCGLKGRRAGNGRTCRKSLALVTCSWWKSHGCPA